jgi:hypothetical protein
VVYSILLQNYIKYSISYEKFPKNQFVLFQFYFLCVFLDSKNPISKYEQLLILTHIDGSTLKIEANFVDLRACQAHQ